MLACRLGLATSRRRRRPVTAAEIFESLGYDTTDFKIMKIELRERLRDRLDDLLDSFEDPTAT